MHLQPPIIVILLVIAAGFVLKHLSVINKKRRFELDAARLARKLKDVNQFHRLFAKDLKGLERFDEAYNNTAHFVSELVDSQALCIFERVGDKLRAIGIAGGFPPMRKSPEYVFTKPRFLLETLKRQTLALGEGIIGEAASAKRPVKIDDATNHPELAGKNLNITINALMVVPMINNEGGLIGVICAVNTDRCENFTDEQFETFQYLADEVVHVYNIISVYKNMSDQQRINQELKFARELQSSLLPRQFPAWDQFLIHSFFQSAKEVSGDFYDFIEIDADRLLVVLGDASGKGVPACMIMAMTRTFIRSNTHNFTTLKDLLKKLNNDLFRDTDEDRFITLACCLLNRREGTIEYARAGHTSLVIFVRQHLRSIYPDGPALGLLPDEITDFDTICLEFQPGMELLLYTDGISEALNDRDEEFGTDRICEVYKASCLEQDTPEKTIETIVNAVASFTGDAVEPSDDRTMVIIKHI